MGFVCPSIPHLFFVDNSLFFFRVIVVKEILLQYEVALGQAVNYHKLATFYSANTPLLGFTFSSGEE